MWAEASGGHRPFLPALSSLQPTGLEVPSEKQHPDVSTLFLFLTEFLEHFFLFSLHDRYTFSHPHMTLTLTLSLPLSLHTQPCAWQEQILSIHTKPVLCGHSQPETLCHWAKEFRQTHSPHKE